VYCIYMDSGTTTTRAFLIKDGEVLDRVVKAVGTRDSAIAGSNEMLLLGLRELYDTLIERFQLREADIESVWMSGMVTSAFGIVEVPHMTLPITVEDMHEQSVKYYEESYFDREIRLVRGAKTVPDNTKITMDNLEYISSTRGEEIDVIGLVGNDQAPKEPFVAIMPSSHTICCYVKDHKFTDVVAAFTGELYYALSFSTLISGEIERGNIEVTKESVRRGYEYVCKYGVCRAIQIAHSSKTFGVGTNLERAQLLTGIITGSAVGLLKKQIAEKWTDVKHIIILGGKPYIESYRILVEDEFPDLSVKMLKAKDGKSFALSGFLELLKLEREKAKG